METTMDNQKDNKRHQSATSNDSVEEFLSTHPSPLLTDEPSTPSKALIVVDPHRASSRSPTSNHLKPPQTFNLQPAPVAYSRTTREEPVTGVTKVNPGGVEDGYGGAGGERRPRTPPPASSRRPKKEVMLDRATLGFRVLEVILSLIAFSVMASDKTQGWSGDSFDRYKEYRYLVAVNAIAFTYAAFQAIDMTYHLIYGKHIISYSLRPHFDFLLDQILAYLLISASSSAATRVDDWVSNWGKDDFTEMATASIGMSFLAFLAFALSSLTSGYSLCVHHSL